MNLGMSKVFLPGLWALVMGSGPHSGGEVSMVKEPPP